MKPTELQIGDWILYGDKPVRVLQLSENVKDGWVEPIPLTPEILEKNGFWVMDQANQVNGARFNMIFKMKMGMIWMMEDHIFL